jgi:hypothetical protein
LSWNELDDQAKTERATERTVRVPSLLTADLNMWRALLRQHGYPLATPISSSQGI